MKCANCGDKKGPITYFSAIRRVGKKYYGSKPALCCSKCLKQWEPVSIEELMEGEDEKN